MKAIIVAAVLSTLAVHCFTAELPVFNMCSFRNRHSIYKGFVQGNPEILRKIKGLRSRVECATYCYSEAGCKTVVYHENGECHLIKTYMTSMNVTEDANNGADIVTIDNYALADEGCPAAGCSGTSKCVVHCFVDGIPQSGCMELSARQYEEDKCKHYPRFSFKEYYLKELSTNTNTQGYVFFTVYFDKIYDWTALRIAFRGTMRGGYGWNAGWIYWRIYINNAQCSDPGYIEGCNYNQENVIDHHKATGLEGTCHNIPAGNTSIDLRQYIGAASYGMIGYATWASRLYVEELGQAGVRVDEQTAQSWKCPDLPSYNLRTWINAGSYGEDYSHTSMAWTYNKLEEETVLKINWDGVIRLYTANTGGSHVCAMWYIQIDNSNCSPQPFGRLLANIDYANYVLNELRSVERALAIASSFFILAASFIVEGYCTGISKGHHSISLRIERCVWSVNGDPVGDANTGWNGLQQRMMVEEIKTGTDVVGVMGPDGDMIFIPQFNYAIYAWAQQNRGEDNAAVLSFSYTKKYRGSGLRLTYSGDGRNKYGNTAFQPCCRHYFKINDAECTTPGPIEGIHYLNRATNVHRPILIDGICEGIDAGEVSIVIHAGICKGYSAVGDCYFGWNSYLNALAAETYVSRQEINF